MSYQTPLISGATAHVLHNHGLDALVDVFDAESIAALIRHAATYPKAPILTALRELFGDPEQVTAEQVEAVGGTGYALLAEVHPDYDAESPREWHKATTLACFDTWRDYHDLSSDADDIVTGGPSCIGDGPDITAEDITRLSGSSWSTDTERLRYRLLHLDGARGIHNVSTSRNGIGHVSADAQGRLDHDSALWVPRNVVAAHAPCPKGQKLAYTPASGWQYIDAHGVRTDAEGAVSAWADEVAASEACTLDEYLSGEVYGVRFQVSVLDVDDEHADPGDYDARQWEDTPEGDLWGIYGGYTEVDVARSGSTAYWQALETLAVDLAAARRVREAERRTRAKHAALVAELDPRAIGLLRAVWGDRFAYITSHSEIDTGLANAGLQLATAADGAPALIALDRGRP